MYPTKLQFQQSTALIAGLPVFSATNLIISYKILKGREDFSISPSILDDTHIYLFTLIFYMGEKFDVHPIKITFGILFFASSILSALLFVMSILKQYHLELDSDYLIINSFINKKKFKLTEIENVFYNKESRHIVAKMKNGKIISLISRFSSNNAYDIIHAIKAHIQRSAL